MKKEKSKNNPPQTEKDWAQFTEELATDEEALPAQEELAVEEDGQSEPQPSLGHPTYKQLEESLLLAEQKSHENWKRFEQTTADLDNFRKRSQKEIAETRRYGGQPLATALLPVWDSLEQALQQVNQADDPAMYEGLELTMELMLSAFEKQGIMQINPIGQPFNIQEHEAMTLQEVPGVVPNTVVTVFQKGYKLGDRIIRPARVIVAK